MKCGKAIQSVIAPYRTRRMYYATHQSEVIDILIDGEKRARQVAQNTMADVHNKMRIG